MTTHADVSAKAAGCARKTRYNDEERARATARRCWYDRGVNLRVYFCEKCAGWHLTKERAEAQMRPGWRPPAPSREEKARRRREAKRRRRDDE